jgi:dihydropteroate synthase
MADFILHTRPKSLALGRETRIMGIVNVTPDSFSDGGDFFHTERAIRHGISLYEQGADILDIGGESTRPFSEAVSVDEELRRVLPVIEALAAKVPVPLSVDTTKAPVAEAAIQAGASMVNDVSALRADPDMARVAARYPVVLVLMHMKGTPRTMQVNPVYGNLLGEILDFLKDASRTAIAKGVDPANLVMDPGIGFGKNLEDNLALLKNLHRFACLGYPLLVGSSRKKFIRSLLSRDSGTELDPKSSGVEIGTQASVAASVMNGAHIVRVHDVASTKITLNILDAIKNAREFPNEG